MNRISKLLIVLTAIVGSCLVGCSFNSAKQLTAENFRRQFELSESARGSLLIGVTTSRVYAETTELIGFCPCLGFGPEISVSWAPLSEFTTEEQASLVAGKTPWSPYLSRATTP